MLPLFLVFAGNVETISHLTLKQAYKICTWRGSNMKQNLQLMEKYNKVKPQGGTITDLHDR